MAHDPVGQNVGQNALCMNFDGPKSSRLYHSCSLLLYSSAGTCTDKSLEHSTKKDLETTYWKILSTQCSLGPPVKCSAFFCCFFCSLIFTVHAPVSAALSSLSIIYSRLMLGGTRRVFPFVVLLSVQIKLGIMSHLMHNKPLSFLARATILHVMSVCIYRIK